MDGFDTNVLVRYLVDDADNPHQCSAAVGLVESARRARRFIFVSDIVLIELSVTLARSYRRDKADIVADLRRLLTFDTFLFEDEALIKRALTAWENGRGDAGLADFLIGQHARRAGARTVWTFDENLRKSDPTLFRNSLRRS